jgi:hypothetical protein
MRRAGRPNSCVAGGVSGWSTRWRDPHRRQSGRLLFPEQPTQLFSDYKSNHVMVVASVTHDETTNALRTTKDLEEHKAATKTLFGNAADKFLNSIRHSPMRRRTKWAARHDRFQRLHAQSELWSCRGYDILSVVFDLPLDAVRSLSEGQKRLWFDCRVAGKDRATDRFGTRW